MKLVDEFRDQTSVKRLSQAIHDVVHHPWKLMEVCGGQTHAILRYGLDQLLPDTVTLVHGPGCPVCVTPVELIDKAIAISSIESVIFCTFGDMLRVPGTRGDLFTARSKGAAVKPVYSPLDAVRMAENHPDREVVFFAVGFETTAPGNALAVLQAREKALRNFSLLVSHVLVPPAMEVILSSPSANIQGFLAAGHVCTVMGTGHYEDLSRRFNVPIVITGFEPVDILLGIYRCLCLLEKGQSTVENQYSRVVQKEGNPAAQAMLQRVFKVADREWRGIGRIPQSGYSLQEEFIDFDAEIKFPISSEAYEVINGCIAGAILQGVQRPIDCPHFGERCTPDNPMGAPMVSGEGACAAYFRYRKSS